MWTKCPAKRRGIVPKVFDQATLICTSKSPWKTVAHVCQRKVPRSPEQSLSLTSVVNMVLRCFQSQTIVSWEGLHAVLWIQDSYTSTVKTFKKVLVGVQWYSVLFSQPQLQFLVERWQCLELKVSDCLAAVPWPQAGTMASNLVTNMQPKVALLECTQK
jgi:hypothetical protein